MYSAGGVVSKAGEQNENQLLDTSAHSHSPHAALSRLILHFDQKHLKAFK